MEDTKIIIKDAVDSKRIKLKIMKFKKTMGELEEGQNIKKIRKEIARLLTKLNENKNKATS